MSSLADSESHNNAPLPASSVVTDGHGPAMFAGFLGWTLDAFDFFLVVLALTAIAQEFHRSDKEIAFSITLTLAFRPVGAFIFGLMADRYGRRIPLMIDLVFYSVVEVATGFAHSFTCVSGAACVVRHRHGRRVGRGRFACDGEGSTAAAGIFVWSLAAGIRAWLPAGGGVATTLSFRAGDGVRCFLSAGCPRCLGFSSASG